MTGDIQMRQTANAEIAQTLVSVFAPFLINIVMMVFYLFVMLRFSPLLTLIGLAAILLSTVAGRIVSEKRVGITRVQMRDQGKLVSSTVSGIQMAETIKASGAENGYFEKWAGYQASVNTQNQRIVKLDQYLGSIPAAVCNVLNIVIMALGVWLTMQGQFTVGMILAFQGILNSFLSPANQLISSGQIIQEMQTSMERIEDVMKYPEDPMSAQRAEAESFDKLSGTLSMRHVTFGYSRLAPPLIENFNLELQQGQRVAFVGPSGCGKSTLAKLISGLYQPWSGEILFDGKPIGEIDRRIFFGSVAAVDQDIIIFEDTIANNIKMWDNSIEDFEMIMAAKDAQIHEDIMQREGGYISAG
jgi:ABC-type bacteriocin/lantibiotic exporter with double-glycine peptidase domain